MARKPRLDRPGCLHRTSKTPLSAIMQNLMFRYTRYANRRTQRHGRLFQGRFKSVLVDEHSYLAVSAAEGLARAELTAPGKGWRASKARALAGLVSQELKADTLTEVGKLTGRDVATLSRTVGRLRTRLMKDAGEARKVRTVLRALAREEKLNTITQA